MIKLEKDGIKTPWFNERYNEKELERLTIDQLILIAKYRRKTGNSFKKNLIEHLLKNNK